MIPVTQLHILRVLLQADQHLTQLQRDMRNNAITWKTQAEGGTVPVELIAQHMNTAANTYQGRLTWVSDFQTNNPIEFPKVVAMWDKLGGQSGEFNDMINPMQTVANQLSPASKTTYAEIINICDLILGAINAPLSLWPE